MKNIETIPSITNENIYFIEKNNGTFYEKSMKNGM
jgi:hypothetical protein